MWVADDNCKSLRERSAIFIAGFYLNSAKYKIHKQVKQQDLWPGAFFVNTIAAGYDAAHMASFDAVWSSFFPEH